jgi:hypothetical protein
MTNGSTDYEANFDPSRMTVGGAGGVLTVDALPPGDALGAANDQQYAFQYGVRVPDTVFTVHTQVLAPFAGMTPEGSESIGLFVGPGGQDDYVKLVLSAHNGAPEVQVVQEVGGVATTDALPFDLADVTAIDFFLTIDKTNGTITARYQTTTGAAVTGPVTDAGAPQSVPASWLDNATQGLAIGLIGTSVGGTPFPATWSALYASAGSP